MAKCQTMGKTRSPKRNTVMEEVSRNASVYPTFLIKITAPKQSDRHKIVHNSEFLRGSEFSRHPFGRLLSFVVTAFSRKRSHVCCLDGQVSLCNNRIPILTQFCPDVFRRYLLFFSGVS